MIKKIVIIAGALVALCVFGYFGRMGYRLWKQEHLVRQARYFASQRDLNNAVLCLQQALQSNPNNVEACRLMADITDAVHSGVTIQWRRQVAKLEPEVLQNKFDWARCAIQYGDLQSAEQALNEVSDAGKKTAGYYKNMGALDWALKRLPEAESNYEIACQLEPSNSICKLNVASLQLGSDSPIKVSQGRVKLEELRNDPEVRVPALHALITDAMHNQAKERALAFSAELVQSSNAPFSDCLMRLEVLNETASPLYTGYFGNLQKEAGTNALRAAELCQWMYSKRSTNDAITWLIQLSPSVRTNQPLPLLLADGYDALGKWSQMQTLLQNHDWGGLEYQRHMLLSRALREQDADSVTGKLEWRNAMKAAGHRLEALNQMAIRASAWGWTSELDETLWTLVEAYPKEQGAFQALYNRLFEAGNTAGLHNLLAKEYAAIPDSVQLKYNYAIIALLLDSKETKAYELAREVYVQDSKNPFFLTTYAYSLYLQHKNAEALKLFENLDPKALDNPSIAAYYGIILAGSGNSAKAKSYLEMAGSAKLLPEEKSLVQHAIAGT